MSRRNRSGRRPTPVDRSIRPEELERMPTLRDRRPRNRDERKFSASTRNRGPLRRAELPHGRGPEGRVLRLWPGRDPVPGPPPPERPPLMGPAEVTTMARYDSCLFNACVCACEDAVPCTTRSTRGRR
jgi:hypothetical protein